MKKVAEKFVERNFGVVYLQRQTKNTFIMNDTNFIVVDEELSTVNNQLLTEAMPQGVKESIEADMTVLFWTASCLAMTQSVSIDRDSQFV